jgi:hypothetical protein
MRSLQPILSLQLRWQQFAADVEVKVLFEENVNLSV